MEQQYIWSKYIEDCICTLLEPICAQAHLALAAQATIRRYHQQRVLFNAKYKDFIHLNASVQAAAVEGSVSPRKKEQLEAVSNAHKIAKKQYEDFAQHLIVELDLFRTQRSLEAKKSLHQYTALQV